MSDKTGKFIAAAIVIFSITYAVANRYEVVPGGAGAVVMSKDSWTGLVEICSPEKCIYH